MIYQISIKTDNVLFFGDSRPKGYNNYGCNWPLPCTFFSAFASALHRVYPDCDTITAGLNTAGPFPQDAEDLYFPTPADLIPGGYLLPLKNAPGQNNLPPPLKHVMYAQNSLSKEKTNPWISASQLERYLRGESAIKTTPAGELYQAEKRVGIGIDNAVLTAEEHVFYTAEYMRMASTAGMTAFVWLEPDTEQRLATMLNQPFDFTFGGQRGVISIECGRNMNKFALPITPPTTDSRLVKYITLSPMLSSQGWLPGFVDERTGKVLIRSGEVKREDFSNRSEWRQALQNQPMIEAELVAAAVGKPVVWSGWGNHEYKSGPGATRLLIPAGSVFYFEAASAAEADKLRSALNAPGKSESMGTQGLGLGICGSYEYIESIH